MQSAAGAGRRLLARVVREPFQHTLRGSADGRWLQAVAAAEGPAAPLRPAGRSSLLVARLASTVARRPHTQVGRPRLSPLLRGACLWARSRPGIRVAATDAESPLPAAACLSLHLPGRRKMSEHRGGKSHQSSTDNNAAEPTTTAGGGAPVKTTLSPVFTNTTNATQLSADPLSSLACNFTPNHAYMRCPSR